MTHDDALRLADILNTNIETYNEMTRFVDALNVEFPNFVWEIKMVKGRSSIDVEPAW